MWRFMVHTIDQAKIHDSIHAYSNNVLTVLFKVSTYITAVLSSTWGLWDNIESYSASIMVVLYDDSSLL